MQKAWYEDKHSFYRALANTTARLALWLLAGAASLYEQIGMKQDAAALRGLLAGAPAPSQLTQVGEPMLADVHKELSWDAPTAVDGDLHD